jgi:predicted PolB exonuclease-like 3'-5' exonuclease
MALRQGKDESLNNFLLRFNKKKKKLMVEIPNKETILNALMHGVNAEGPLMVKLAKISKTITLRHFLNNTEEYINQE